jgi:hypothetical protein
MPNYIHCPHCGEHRDTSNRYTSPANAERDARLWREEHETGACVGGMIKATREGPKMGGNRLTLDLGREMAEYVAEVLNEEPDLRARRLAVLIDTALETGAASQTFERH